MSLQVANISKSFETTKVLKDVSLTAEEGEFVALLGPSGSGKTTLLRVIAGLEVADAGGVGFRGEDLLAKPVRQRGIGLVFQHYALFRHMTAAQNIAFGMRSKAWRARPSEREVRAKVAELLALVQLDGLGDRFPSQLSGGQRQRIALARALAIEPSILLLDEPFGALDAKVRRELRIWLRDIHERTGLTTIFVTHDQEEALDLADRVAVLRDGALEQVGTPEALYHEPASGFVFDFLGDTLHLPCTVDGDVAVIGETRVPIVGPPTGQGSATAYARPHALMISKGEGQGLRARVRDVSLAGPDARIECVLDERTLLDVRVDHAAAAQFKPGDRVTLLPRSVRVWAS